MPWGRLMTPLDYFTDIARPLWIWLIGNKDWLFSGAGIVLLTTIGGWLWRRRQVLNYPIKQPVKESEESTVSLQFRTVKSVSLTQTFRISVGDFIDIKLSQHSNLRIILQEVSEAGLPDRYRVSETTPAARIRINCSDFRFSHGVGAKRLGYDEYMLPVEGRGPEQGVFDFSNYKDGGANLLCITLQHVNLHANTADVYVSYFYCWR
jgi:hypothetical protein